MHWNYLIFDPLQFSVLEAIFSIPNFLLILYFKVLQVQVAFVKCKFIEAT
jgi:hypothetical protein